MRVNIMPQFAKIAKWYWANKQPGDGTYMSIWDRLRRDYGARRVHDTFIVIFPDEKYYTLFLLKWA